MSEETYERQALAAKPARPAMTRGKWAGRIVRMTVTVAVIGAAAATSAVWLANPPKARRRPPAAQATLVETETAAPHTETVVVHAMGTVVPEKEIELAARVGGEIIQVADGFLPGGRFDAGAELVWIDPKDYELAVQQRQAELVQRQSDVIRAESDLKTEMGQQAVAKREYELLGQELKGGDEALVLRQPQLLAAQAARDSARATKDVADVALKEAELDLERTTVRAPFNAVMKTRHVDLGSQVSAGAPLATLAGTDKYWIQALLPLSQLKWVRIPGVNSKTGSTVRVFHESAWGNGVQRTGTVERLMTDLEPQGRMARLLVTVDDPLGLKAAPEKRHPFILGSYVRVEIVGCKLTGIVRLPRTSLREGNQVWVIGKDEKLEVRDVTIAWSDKEDVYLSHGVKAGDRLITSDLGAPVPGMALRTAQSVTEEPDEEAKP